METEPREGLDKIAERVRIRFPRLPESEIVGSQAWKEKVQAELVPHLKESIKGAGKLIGR